MFGRNLFVIQYQKLQAIHVERHQHLATESSPWRSRSELTLSAWPTFHLTKGTFLVSTGEFSTKLYEYNGENRVGLGVDLDSQDLVTRAAAAGDDRRAARDEFQSVTGSQAAGGAAVTDLEDEIPF